jgi:flagellar basal body-associated protein FliL
MAAYDDLDVKRIFAVGFLSIFVLAVTALAVQVLYFAMLQTQQAETSSESDYRRQNAILAEQAAEISSYGVNPDTGNVVIPIDQAIELMVKENKKDEKKSDSDKT